MLSSIKVFFFFFNKYFLSEQMSKSSWNNFNTTSSKCIVYPVPNSCMYKRINKKKWFQSPFYKKGVFEFIIWFSQGHRAKSECLYEERMRWTNNIECPCFSQLWKNRLTYWPKYLTHATWSVIWLKYFYKCISSQWNY